MVPHTDIKISIKIEISIYFTSLRSHYLHYYQRNHYHHHHYPIDKFVGNDYNRSAALMTNVYIVFIMTT